MLHKRFLRQAGCDLRIGSEHFDGSAAEEHLADVLGFSLRRRGGSGPDDWGVPGLLWVLQGELHKLAQAVTPATSHLGDALGASVGALASSDSDGVLAEVERRLAELLTGTGKPRAEYDKALKEQAELTAQVERLTKESATYRKLVDHLESLGERFRREQDVQVWSTLRGQIPALHHEATQAEQREARLLQLTTELKTLEQEKQYISQALQNHDADQARYTQLLTVVRQLEISMAQGQEQLQQAEATRDMAVSRMQKAQAQRQAATASAQWRMQRREHEQLEHRLAQLRHAKQSVDTLLEQQQQVKGDGPAIVLRAEDINALRKAEHAMAVLLAQLEMVSTRLDFQLLNSEAVTVAGSPLTDSSQPLQITEQTTIAIADVGLIHISPGGQDLAKLRDQLHQAQLNHARLLKQLSVTDLAQAEHCFREQEKRLIELRRIESQISIHAPAGLSALEKEIVEVTERIQYMPARPPADLRETLSVDEAQAIEQAAQNALERDERVLQGLNQSGIENRVKLAAAKDEINRLQTHINSEAQSTQSQQHLARLTLINTEIQQAEERRAELESTRQHGRSAADVRAVIAGLEGRAVQAERAFYDLQIELSKVETELQIVGAQGLDEQLASTQAALSQALQRCDQFRQRAETLEHLKQYLMAARSSLRERLQAPLLKRINYYLEFLFPGSSIELNDNFVPKVLHRENSNSAELLELSFGALEQIAVISRLAYADLLKEAGKPTLIVLDDVLSYSDEYRLARMKAAIYDASKRHQILLFTCNPHMWNDAGGQVINIEQLKLRTSI
ncbi:hypothetical protein L1889_06250 [Paenalcaligenes niemegkensis]|uniref:ATP-binding protein n=1 Tax=Paenalcaligenes niemegkensis TaxID=2895469 RepID=UPI001EE9292B|nr:hypothetical protein [Paenalcaligenes niemegkensis]MCQ9616349.1 hypothetical protein [Paenalcaligenes niemegkensis]